MQEKTSKIAEKSAQVGLNINVAKTKIMKLNPKCNRVVKIGNESIEEVDKFTYLGSVVTPSGGTEEDVNARINKARTAFSQLNKIWDSKILRQKTKIKIFTFSGRRK